MQPIFDAQQAQKTADRVVYLANVQGILDDIQALALDGRYCMNYFSFPDNNYFRRYPFQRWCVLRKLKQLGYRIERSNSRTTKSGQSYIIRW